MADKIPGWDDASDQQKLDLLHQWFMNVSGRLQEHEKLIAALREAAKKPRMGPEGNG